MYFAGRLLFMTVLSFCFLSRWLRDIQHHARIAAICEFYGNTADKLIFYSCVKVPATEHSDKVS